MEDAKKESGLNATASDKAGARQDDLSLAAVVAGLLTALNEREQEVLKGRFGLLGASKTTLEAVGQRYHLTRERVRQIEAASINKIRKQADSQPVNEVRQLIQQILAEHGGLIDKQYLLNILRQLTNDTIAADEHNRAAEFLITRVLANDFDYNRNAQYFNHYIKTKDYPGEHWEQVASELVEHIRNLKELLTTREIIKLIKNLNSYQERAAKFAPADATDLSDVLKKVMVDYSDELYADRSIYNLLQAVSEVEHNRYQQWGHSRSREINPKTINDKIYLVLKNNGQPMYYGDIAKKISAMSFDGKAVNTATTHNELILDDKYVLVGRGLYGLTEWGYKSGTVLDIIADILTAASQPLNKEAITREVLKQRLVKETTINLALMNKDRFQRLAGGLYQLTK